MTGMDEIAPGVWRGGTRFVNWFVVDGGDGLTMIDAGLPGYRSNVARGLASIGRAPKDVAALVLTHGHIDHVGTSGLLAEAGAEVHLHPADVALAADPRRNKTDSSLVPYLRYPPTWAFLAHCVAEGAVRPDPLPATVPLTDGAIAAVPGKPRVTHTPGHTDGSCILEFPEHGVVFVGDLLCTVSPVSGRRAAPQLQTRASNRDSDQAMASIDRLAGVEAGLVLPGHGGPWRDGVEAAVASVRRIGCR
jgi:glyoxylase-like metal-dependent hydrolase (beta-lactamase superfamily II)